MSLFRTLISRRALVAYVVVGGLAAVALWPSVTAVDTVTVARGALVLTIDDEGRTRIRDKFVIAAPLHGRVQRIELEPGDAVTRGQMVTRLRPEQAPLLDARARAEAQEAVGSAQAVLGRARAEEQRAQAALGQAERERRRVRELVANELSTARELDAREADVSLAQETLNAAQFAVRAAQADLSRAEVRAMPTPDEATGKAVAVVSPVDGTVLKRVRESEALVPAGEPLLEVGDPRNIEIVVDLLSTDAVRVAPGTRAIIAEWGGPRPLDARVRRVEPSGFTKVSALGVEEQRVNVILDFVDPPADVQALGDGFRVVVRIVTWESPDVLKVPTSALFRSGNAWAAYRVVDARAALTRVQLGHQTGQEAEVVGGLAAGDTVVAHPGDTLTDGARLSQSVANP